MTEKSGQQIMTDVARDAHAKFQRNMDTLVAGFLIRNPDVKPEDVELVMRVEGSTIRFTVEPKELHVPPVREVMPMEAFLQKHRDMDESDYDAEVLVTHGWNACRDAMIAQAQAVRTNDGTMVTLLKDVIDG